eukprot:TRINITY_DN3522_c0_g2_i1.p1 TRINITY_DN3522_c0_g2~~TRINITY_DN3522_c0_g2_i1.p1  ORF type:complete len:365 (+),score=89.44 TRINITY_DN3522_c0_g2_i1:51-1145(+)
MAGERYCAAADRRLARALKATWAGRVSSGKGVGGQRGVAPDGSAAEVVEAVHRAVRNDQGGLMVYTVGISVLGQWGLLREARMLESDMEADGVAHDVYSLTALMSAHAHHGDVLNVRRLFRRCCDVARTRTGREFEPNNPTTLNALLLAHVNNKDPEGLFDAYYYITRTQRVNPNIVMVTTALLAFEEYPAAWAFFSEELKRYKLSPNIVTYNNLLSACHGDLDVRGAEEVLSMLEEDCISPTSVTYTLLMALYRRAGDVDKALLMYPKVVDRTSIPVVRELLKCVAAAGDADLLPAACKAYTAAVGDGAPPLTLATALLSAYKALGLRTEQDALYKELCTQHRYLPVEIHALCGGPETNTSAS